MSRLEATTPLRAIVSLTTRPQSVLPRGASRTLSERIAFRARFGTDAPNLRTEIVPLPVTSLRTPDAVQLLKQLDTDILVVCTAPILPKSLWGAAALAAVNVHFGIAPQYRGMHGIFWALKNNDYDKVGATLHHMTHRVDAGRILARGYPALEPSDGEQSAIAKSSSVAAELVGRYLQAAESDPARDGIIQADKRRAYRASDRTLKAEMEFAFHRLLRRRRPPHTKERCEYFF